MASVAIRVDASRAMGTGHLRRCLSLAQALTKRGVTVHLVSRRLDGVATTVLSSMADMAADLHVHWLSAPAGPWQLSEIGPPHQAWACVSWSQDARETIEALLCTPPAWLIVDHYAFDEHWHAGIRQGLGCRLLVIDDIADRMLDADALLDHNWNANHQAKYVNRLRRDPHWLTGPRYALLSAAYQDAPRYRFHAEVRSLGIFMGGTDPDGMTLKVLAACRESGFQGAIEVISTSANPYLTELRTACATFPGTTLTLDEPDLATFFARHDLQIGAGGGATWERCCMAVPSVAIAIAANQHSVLEPLRDMGVLYLAKEDLSDLALLIRSLIANPQDRQSLAQRAGQLVDGQGTTRVATFLCDTC